MIAPLASAPLSRYNIPVLPTPQAQRRHQAESRLRQFYLLAESCDLVDDTRGLIKAAASLAALARHEMLRESRQSQNKLKTKLKTKALEAPRMP